MLCYLFVKIGRLSIFIFFFFNDTATTEIYTLSLHDALPIFVRDKKRVLPCAVLLQGEYGKNGLFCGVLAKLGSKGLEQVDRKSTRLNSSHSQISYAVFCLKKKK